MHAYTVEVARNERYKRCKKTGRGLKEDRERKKEDT